MSKRLKVFNWIFAVFCILCLPVYGFEIGAIMLFLLGVVALPIKPVKNLWNKIPIQQNWVKPTILGVLFLVGVMIIPKEAIDSKNTDNSKSAKTEISISNTTETEEKETLKSTKEAEKTSTPEPEPTPVPTPTPTPQTKPSTEITLSVASIPAYAGNPYVVINNHVTGFKESDLSTTSYEYYSELDSLGRCGVVYACIGKDLMPTEERGEIGSVKPSGWQTVKYDVVDGKYLYNRCHLIGYQLSGENANTKNLITGTRYMNVEGMLPFENLIADYVQETGNHVLYRVTPIFEGNNLLASGVQLEAISVEDRGAGIMFNVYCYNVQPGVIIDYASGISSLETSVVDNSTTNNNNSGSSGGSSSSNTSSQESTQQQTTTSQNADTSVNNEALVWIPKTGSKYHSNAGCSNMKNPSQVTKSEAVSRGYEPCKKCY